MTERVEEYFNINKKVVHTIVFIVIVLGVIWMFKEAFLTAMVGNSRAASSYPQKIGDQYVDINRHLGGTLCPVPAGSEVFAWAGGGNIDTACRAKVVKGSYKTGGLYYHSCIYSRVYFNPDRVNVNMSNCYDAGVAPTYAVGGGIRAGVTSKAEIAANASSLCTGAQDPETGGLIYEFSGTTNPKCYLRAGKAKIMSNGLVNCVNKVINDPVEIASTCCELGIVEKQPKLQKFCEDL